MLNHLTALVVDDSPTARETVCLALQPYGIECVHASSLAECHAFLRHGAFDFIILDLIMPDTTSPQDTVKSVHDRAPSAAIIVLTMMEDSAVAMESIQLGATDFLLKDSVHELPVRIAQAYRHHLLSNQLARITNELRNSIGG